MHVHWQHREGHTNFMAIIPPKLREPLSILMKFKTIDTPKIDNMLKIYFDVSTKL